MLVSWLHSLYQKLVLEKPIIALAIVMLMVLSALTQLSSFQFDASSETLLLKNDPQLEYYRSIKGRYGSDEYLFITYTPNQDLFSDASIARLKALKADLLGIKNVEYVFSILDAPLVKSPPITLKDLNREIYNIENGNVDLTLAKTELLTSPVYSNLLISKDSKTAGIVVGMVSDKNMMALIKERDAIRAQRLNTTLTAQEQERLGVLDKKIEHDKSALIEQQKIDIQSVRTILANYRDDAELFLGGVPMIASDSIEYIRKDVYWFGGVVFALLVIILVVIFKEARWVILPLTTCIMVGVTTMGLFGTIGWPVTVVSSNFLPLLLIMTLSLVVHLIVKFKEVENDPQYPHLQDKVAVSIKQKFSPCLYTALTTMVAFCSLLVSGIQPLIDFGLMMSVGIVVSFIFTFLFFPACLMLMTRTSESKTTKQFAKSMNLAIAHGIKRYQNVTVVIFICFTFLSGIGITALSVENRFIDYFKESTEIYQGMEAIDKRLGGTTPLDIILDPPQSFYEKKTPNTQVSASEEEQDDFWDEMDAGLDDSAGIAFESYFFNTNMLKEIKKIHQYLEDLPESGKVLSLYSTMDMLYSLDVKTTYDDMYLSILYATVPEKIKDNLFKPYVSPDGNQLRFSIRVFETDKNLKRQELINRIKSDITEKFELEDGQIHLTGMLKMYNNVLQSFFRSQILTMGIVFFCIFLMFIVTFKSIKLAALALLPNLFAGLFVLGLMGWLSIPLDLMTITIAAICVGIAVDDTIHYVHRFKVEYVRDYDYWAAVKRSHASIGLAMFFTTIIITLGFSVLVFSNFVPTIYFGLLTGCSLLVALIADLALLPLVLVLFKPMPARPLSEA